MRSDIFSFRYIASEILQGLHYLHTLPNPIIHRDIKPSNILVLTDCECPNPLACVCRKRPKIVRHNTKLYFIKMVFYKDVLINTCGYSWTCWKRNICNKINSVIILKKLIYHNWMRGELPGTNSMYFFSVALPKGFVLKIRTGWEFIM